MKRLRNAILQIFSKEYQTLINSSIGMKNYQQTDDPHFNKVIRSYFQGDLVFAPPQRVAIVAADAGGGLAQLAKYWHIISKNENAIQCAIALFYVHIAFRSEKSTARRELWNFVRGQAKYAVGPKLHAHFATCRRPAHIDCHADISQSLVNLCQEQIANQGMLQLFHAFFNSNVSKVSDIEYALESPTEQSRDRRLSSPWNTKI